MSGYAHPGPPHPSVSEDVDHVPTMPEGLHGLANLGDCHFLNGIRGYDTYVDHIVSKHSHELESYAFRGIRTLGDVDLNVYGAHSHHGSGFAGDSRGGLKRLKSRSPEKHVCQKSMFVCDPSRKLVWFYRKDTSGKHREVGVLMPRNGRLELLRLERNETSLKNLVAWFEQLRRSVSPTSVEYVASTGFLGLTQKSIFSFTDCISKVGLPPTWVPTVTAAGIYTS